MAGKLSINFDLGQSTQNILQLKKRTAENIVEIGLELIEVKKNLKHGQWLKWLEEEVKFSQSTAWRFMQVAQNPKLFTVNNFTIRQITKEGISTEFEFDPKVYNIWNFAGRN